MGKIAFLPWLTLEADIKVGAFHALRYRRGEMPGRDATEQALIDQVLSAYRDMHGKPVGRATVLQHSEQDGPVSDIDQSFHLDFFVFAELLAFAGLSGRRFFGPFHYSNRDNYRLVLQEFTDPGRGVSVTTRRRDGGTNTFFSGDSFVARRPHHAGFDRVRVDRELLVALIAAMPHDAWPRLYQGILLFNEANTDRLEMPAGTELILAYSAIEQLLDMAGRSPNEVADRFNELVSPREPLPREAWTIARANQRAQALLDRSPSLRAAWIRDLGVSRGSLAHGHAVKVYPACWQPHEHLLLAAHVVPLVMKLQLQRLGFYGATRDDVGGVEVIEPLLNEDHFNWEPGEGEDRDEKHPWLRIVGREQSRRLARLMAEEFFRERNAAS